LPDRHTLKTADRKPSVWGKMIAAGVIAGLILLFFLFGGNRYVTFEYLQESRQEIWDLYQARPLLVSCSYFALYLLVVGLSLPGATILGLGAGAVFGFWVGTVLISFVSTISATLACLIARYVLGFWVQRTFAERLRTINAGIEAEGPFYLFALRLVPLFPFVVINLVMGLTRMPLGRFYWVSQIGMLPGTMVYVNAGRQLAQLDSPAGILSPGLLISFSLLGLFPLAAKKVLKRYRQKTTERCLK
jgi:uncharacterized membrane protein YdjX (TVP38/TMEM64 family)